MKCSLSFPWSRKLKKTNSFLNNTSFLAGNTRKFSMTKRPRGTKTNAFPNENTSLPQMSVCDN